MRARRLTSLNMAQPPGQGERVMALYSTRPSTSSGNRIMMQREARTPVFGARRKSWRQERALADFLFEHAQDIYICYMSHICFMHTYMLHAPNTRYTSTCCV